jgi:hypothetical protein
METEGQFSRRFKELKSQLRRQTAAVEELGAMLNHRANGVLRHDQAVFLDSLKAKVMEEAEYARLREIVAKGEFRKEKLSKGIIKFAVGTVGAAIAGQKNPLLEGVSSFKSAMEQKAPFDTVVIAIGQKGLPEDVTVLPLSRLARDYNRSETLIRDALKNRGYLLMTPLRFATLVDNLKSRVLDGFVSLPLSVDKIATELSRIARRPGPMLGS